MPYLCFPSLSARFHLGGRVGSYIFTGHLVSILISRDWLSLLVGILHNL